MSTRKITTMGLLLALALILSFVESQIPAFVAIPGIKIGLANIVVVFCLYSMGFKEAVLVSLLRVLLSSLLFGSLATFAYSITGALLSVLVMALLKRTKAFGVVAVSVSGAVMHNLGQILVAMMLMGWAAIVYYLPFLIFSAVGFGIVIGVAAALLLRRIPLEGRDGP